MEDKMNKTFNVGDRVRDKRFNVPIYGEVLSVNNEKKRLVIKTEKGNFSVSFHMMERI